jgi:bacterial/archaeal transporter family-2 protein
VAVALGAGVAGSVQVAVMGRFGERVGTLEALAFTTLLGGLIAAVALLVARRSLDGYSTAFGAPKWLWLGAAIGVFVIAAITFAGPRIGTTATVALLIAGQLGAALAIDRLGWFGVERVPVTGLRILGVALLAVGAALTLRR